MKKISKNLILTYKTRNDKEILSRARLKFDKTISNFFSLTPEIEKLMFYYEDKKIEISNKIADKEIEIKDNEKIEKIVKNISLLREKNKNDYFSNLIAIPLGVINDMGINKENKKVYLTLDEMNKKLIISNIDKHIEEESMIPKKIKIGEKEVETRFLEEIEFRPNEYIKYAKRNGKVITVKVGKGGIGKTFITTQIGAGLAEAGLKVLIITSDPQNDILGMCFKDEPEYESGLKSWVMTGNGDLVKLRKNLDFIPLEDNEFGKNFQEKFDEFVENMRYRYDYILIDSMPMMAIDKIFHNQSDKVIIPALGDKFTIKGAIKVMNEIGVNKVLAIIFNFYDNTVEQKKNLELVVNEIKGTNISIIKPIKKVSYIKTLTGRGNTIWDNKRITKKENGEEEVVYFPKLLDETRESIEEVIMEIFKLYEPQEEITINI